MNTELLHDLGAMRIRGLRADAENHRDFLRRFAVRDQRQHLTLTAGEWVDQYGLHAQTTHFFIVTMVPLPTSDAISNSSISRREPRRPNPRPLPMVEWLSSCSKVATSAMPGP